MPVKTFVITVLLLTLVFSPCLAQDAAVLRLNQAQVQWPGLKIYFDVLDSDGISVHSLLSGRLTATVGSNPVTVKEVKSFADSGEGLSCTLLVDISLSRSDEQFQQMKEALHLIIDNMSEKDYTSIITFGTDVNTLQEFTTSKAALKAKIDLLTRADHPTKLYEGLATAIEMNHINDFTLPAKRSIIIMSDGKNDFSQNISQAEVSDKIRLGHIPIYAIGISSLPPSQDREKDLQTLSQFAHDSGGEYYQGDALPLLDIYSAVMKQIHAGFIARLTGDKLTGDNNNRYRVEVKWIEGPKILTDNLDILMTGAVASLVDEPLAPPPPDDPDISSFPWKAVISGVALSIFSAVGFRLYKRKRRIYRH